MKSICNSAVEANINQAMKGWVQTITDTQRSSGAQWVVLKRYWIQHPVVSLFEAKPYVLWKYKKKGKQGREKYKNYMSYIRIKLLNMLK